MNDLQQANDHLVAMGFRKTGPLRLMRKAVGENSFVQARIDVDNDEVIFTTVINGMLGETVAASPLDALVKARRILHDVRSLSVC